MRLHSEWRKILRKAWSIRLAAVAGLFSGTEVVLPYFVDSMPRGWFAGISLLAAVASMVSRTIAQPRMLE